MRFRPPLLLALLCLLLPSLSRAQINAALGKPVTTQYSTSTATATWPGAYTPANLTDGNFATFSHPNTMTNTLGFKYDIDLGRSYVLDRLRVYNRNDACCPDRLTKYRVSVLADNGSGAPLTPALWSAVIRNDGTNSGNGGMDEILPSLDPAGTFTGRWIRVENTVNTAYTPQVAEVQALTMDGVTDPNLALYKPVVFRTPANVDTPTYGTFAASNITDGNPSTFSHPNTLTAPATQLGYYYQVDLGSDSNLGRVVLYGRTDGCCQERLSNFRVGLYADNAGQPGAEVWHADLHTDGTWPPTGGADTITPEMGTGSFHGRFVRVTNLSSIAYNPQIGEIEAYKPPAPVINFFTTTAGNITHGATPALPTQATLSWKVTGATSVTIDQAIGSVAFPEGTQVVSPASQKTYTLTATNTTGTSTATVTIAVDAAQVPPRINEFMAENDGALSDEDGDNSDWVELSNPNAFTVSLTGAHLTDNAALPQKWTFPAGATIPPNGYLVVFASNKNRAVAGAQLHTNFELKKSGEALFLYAPGGTTLWSQIPGDYPATLLYPAQSRDTSYGVNGSGDLRFFRPATPGAVNAATGYTAVVDDTSFSVKRGIYATPQSVAITCATPGVTIRYTTNGTKPTDVTGTVYSAPIAVSTTTVIRAAAFLANAAPSNVDTHTYIFPASVSSQPNMLAAVTGNATWNAQIPAALQDVPSISLTTANSAAYNDNTEIETSFEWIHNTDPLQSTHANCGVQYFGGAFTNFAKKSFRLFFRGLYGDKKLSADLFEGQEHGYHAVKDFDSLEIRNGSHDMKDRGFYMSNLFTDQVMSELGNLSPHGRFIHVYINGSYWGLYHLRERWNAAMHSSYLGGSKDDYEAVNGNYNVGGWADPGTPFDGDGSAWQNIKTKRANYSQIRGLVDVKDYTDYMITWMFGNSEDEWRHVGPNSLVGNGSGIRLVINDSDGWLSINGSNAIATWDGNDNNTARASTWNGSVFGAGRTAGDGPGAIFSAMILTGGVDYKTLLADRIHAALFNDGPLTPARNQARLDAMCQPLARSFIAEGARWNYRLPADPPGGAENAGDWEDAWAVCRNSWMPTRTSTVLTYFRNAGLYPTLNAPIFTPNGGIFSAGATLTIPAPPAGSSVYYTLDGSDPRSPGGAIAPGALLYSVPLTLQSNTIVRARTRDGSSNWSALQERFFQLDTSTPCPAGAVVPAELHFNPSGDDDAEFIELLNVSHVAVNLSGCHFTAGVNFAFSEYRDTLLAPGQRIVLVDSEFAHRARYGWDREIGGIYFDNLSNDGEQLTFVSKTAAPIFGFSYADTWHRLADGGGPSLVLVHPASGQNLGDSSNWRAGQGTDGTPGLSDSGPAFAGNPAADLDGDGKTAFMEYALGTSDTQPDFGEVIQWDPLTPGGFSVTHASAADDAVLTPEVSKDLATWTGVPNSLTGGAEERLPDGRVRAAYLPSPAFLTGATRYYVRLRVTAR